MKVTDNLEDRYNTLLNGNGELSLAIEGRFTNLRIWSTKHDNLIYMRLDRANNYSAPLREDTLNYLDKPNNAVIKLSELFGFNGATKADIKTIIDITKDMAYRDCIEW